MSGTLRRCKTSGSLLRMAKIKKGKGPSMRKISTTLMVFSTLTVLGSLLIAPPSRSLELCNGRQPSAEPVGVAAPEVLYAPTGERIWVSAARAERADGTLDLEVLGEEYTLFAEGIREQPTLLLTDLTREPSHAFPIRVDDPETGDSEIWLYYGQTSRDDVSIPQDPTLEVLVNRAAAVFLGKVVGMTPGFLGGYAATLLTIRLDRVRSFNHAVPESAELICLYYPKACFSIAGNHYWKGNVNYPDPPELGARVLATTERSSPAVTWKRSDHRPYIVYPEVAGLFFEEESGEQIQTSYSESVARRAATASLDAMMTEMIRARDAEE